MNVLRQYLELMKDLLVFKEPKKINTFTLEENDADSQKLRDEQSNPQNKKNEENSIVSRNLTDNLSYMKQLYSIPINSDIKIREFNVALNHVSMDAFIIFFDGMTNTKVINDNILQPLMLLSNLNLPREDKDWANTIYAQLITHNQVKATNEYRDVLDEVNFGGCGIFIDGLDVAFAADVKGWQSRSVGRPNTEIIIRGPQEGFTEGLRINTGLVRKILKDEDLLIESVSVGRRSKTPCAMLYMKDIVNDSLVAEVRKRLNNIFIDNILDSGELEQLIEDASYLPLPQTIATERPDRVAAMLTEGKVAIILNGSPFALVVPATLPELVHSAEDSYIRFPYVNLLRFLRWIGMVMALLLPGIFVAVTNYHHELIPTALLISIVATREVLPFPVIVEILLMELAFELIREAGIRIPGPIGPTLGIVAGLVLGQAAVVANIVSPIMIIIVAIAGIGSFSIPNFSLAFAFRILKFGFIILGVMAGFFGIAIGLFLMGLWFLSAKSFGVPMLSPISPVTSRTFMNDLSRAPIWKQEIRPDFLSAKEERKQPRISRKWQDNNSGEGEDNGE